jgi:hypothetical protein
VKKYLIGLFCALVVAFPAQARELHLIGGDDQIVSFVDRDTITRTGKIATIETLIFYKTHQNDGIYATRIAAQFDCPTRGLRFVATLSYDDNMKPVGLKVYPASAAFTLMGDESEAFYDAACNAKYKHPDLIVPKNISEKTLMLVIVKKARMT